MANCSDNNKVYFCGEVADSPVYSHQIYDETFYSFTVSIVRLSGKADVLPATISERLLDKPLSVGDKICAMGQLRTYNITQDGKNHHVLTVFVRELFDEPKGDNPNSIVLSGYLCKPVQYRMTPFNREIADMLIAVNRLYNKSDYIPAIAWSRNARFVRGLNVGDRVALCGRIQSREYKKGESVDGEKILTVYEVSVARIVAFDNDDEFDVESEFDLFSQIREVDGRDADAVSADHECTPADSWSREPDSTESLSSESDADVDAEEPVADKTDVNVRNAVSSDKSVE